MRKNILRKQMIDKRMKLTDEEVKNKSNSIISKIEEKDFFENSKNIAIYYPFKNEVDLLNLFEKYKENKNFFFPKTCNKTMNFHKVSSLSNFEKGNFGVMEPTEDISECSIDLFLIPGVAFSPSLYRIGYGGGFYDKYIENIKYPTILIGVAFDIQVIDDIPVEEHDKKVDKLITEKEVFSDESKSSPVSP